MFSTRIKILVGYALLAFVLLSATWMVYDNTRSLSAVNRASERLMARRDIVDSLVYSMLETANAERSILLGNADEWRRFDHAIKSSADKANKLRPLLSDTIKQQRIDSLVDLLADKRANTMLIMAELGKDNRDIFFNNKMMALQSGRDSVVINPRTQERSEQHETVYEVVKSQRGFFRRLGDAFRRQHTDTVGMTHISKHSATDTVDHRLNIADSVANALAEIRHDEQRATGKHKEIIANRNSQLQMVSVQLAWRTGQLLEDIQSDEHTALQKALSKAISSRRAMIIRIAALGLLAILTAAILVVYILRDIRRERRDHNRIIEAKAETERIMQQRERLLLTITHDIKAPAASIAGFIDLLGEYVDRPKAVGYLQSINGSAKHLLQLVSALLDYHQLESGKAELHKVSFAPATLIKESTNSMMPQALAKNLCLKTEIMVKETMMCRSDAFRLKQIVNNLVGNAIKYTDNGEVTVGVAMTKGNITIYVADTGCGMTQEEQQRVFNAFTRLPDAQGKEGVGLGLSITREIVHKLGGSINVSSRKGYGSKFTVIIPVEIVENNIEHKDTSKRISDSNTIVPNNAEDHSTDTINSNRISVLIVDDDRLQQQLLQEMFDRIEGIDFNITATTHAHEAINIAQEKAPRIVFTDIEMPEMNGREIMKRIRNNNDRIKFVAITAHEQSIMPQLRSEGFDACLFKPFSVQILAATICQLTGRMVRVREEKKMAENNSIRSALLPFTDGDEEAENQIIADIRKSIDEYLGMLLDPTNTELIAKAAHKAMPLLEMLQPGKNEWLSKLTPEHIGETDGQERESLAKQLAEKLKQIKTSAV